MNQSQSTADNGRNWRLIALSLAGLLLVITAATASYQYLSRVDSPLPEDIRSQLSFSPLIIPVGSEGLTATGHSYGSAENSTATLVYQVNLDSGKTVTISQSVQPPQFSEIPEFKEQFLNNSARQYATVQTANGTVYLGHPAPPKNSQLDADDLQLAIMFERGLLVMMSPDQELTDEEWRRIGDNLTLQKI